ncbi:hypothetical protein L1I79_16005 [Strepomyces sp. STD 3.1]|uniref:hypothetical protein n=1 Tax=Streptomyces sp. NPDC058985 TaxID=3346684 RepID=UPI001F378952|nr:hypothetical protein [Streptomyces sp. STD 3.1]
MREKPFGKIGDELLRIRRDASRAVEGGSAPAGFGVDQELITAFGAGTLSPAGQRELAQQVARELPAHWSEPNKLAEAMSRFIDDLGGQRKLIAWLDEYPGLPRLVARLYVLMGLLDQYSENPAVVAALREYREREPYPAGLKGYLLPQTNDETLAGLSFTVEELLSDGQQGKAVDLALATTDCLQRVAPRAEELDPALDDLGEVMDHTHQDLQEAAAEG